MKTRLLALCISITFINYLHAQVPDTSTTQKLLQYIFSPIDKSQVPTGFLEEYGCPMLPFATFNGTLTDSNRMDMHLWRTLYFQLQTSYCQTGTNPLPAITSVNTTILQNVSSTLPVPIPLIIGRYDNVKSNAFSTNLLSYNSSKNQIFDVAGRTQSPYTTKSLFAACPNKSQTITGSEQFIVKSNMIWNNTGKTIQQIQVDFANGQGFKTITIGTAVAINYTDTGSKRWTLKVKLSDNSILQCYSDFYVLKSSVSTIYSTDQTVIPAGWGVVGATANYKGATVYVNYSNRSKSNTLRKPLIVVEGYDVSFVAPSLQPNYSYDDFIDGINDPSSYNFNSQLDDIAGYDLVFIDFNDGADDIVKNAAIVQEVINRVNANKVLDNRFGNIRQQNVVMGLSMGGLCARYALANMTKNFPGTPTETRLLITHDSPHHGANVPLGLQYMIRMLGGVQLFGYTVTSIYPDYNDAISLLDAPATKQLLVYSSLTANTYANNTFLDGAYRSMITFSSSGPQPTYRFIATSLGNECAHPLFSPGKTFINLGVGVSAGIDARFLFFRVPILSYRLGLQVEAYALPNTGSTNKIARVYSINNLKLFGLINIFKQLYDNTANAPGTQLAIDGVPGSNYPLLDVKALNQLTNLPTFALNLYISFPLGPFLSGYFGLYAYNQGVSYNFTFVPVASALDANPFNTSVFTQKYVNGVNQFYPSTAETFIAQESTPTNPATTNNVHIAFTDRNAHWLYNEMENLPNLLNCSSECSNPYYISGTSTMCATSVFTIPGMQRGASINWTATPGIVGVVQSGASVTLTPSGSGQITLMANITNACSGQAGFISKIIQVGTYSHSQYPIYAWPATVCYGQQNQQFGLLAGDVPNATSYNWIYPSGGFTYVSGQGTRVITLRVPPYSPNQTGGDVGLSVGNACGTSSFFPLTHFNYSASCRLRSLNISVSPNPVTSGAHISFLDDDVSADLSSQNSTPIRTIESAGKTIFTLFGVNTNTPVKQWSFKEIKNQDYRIDFSGIQKGVYILQVDRNGQSASTKLMVN